MSDQTSLSVEYTANASFAQDVNQAVLEVKRRQLEMCPTPSGAAADDAAAKLAVVLETVALRLEDQAVAAQVGEETPLIPDEVIDRLIEENNNRRDWFLQDIRDTAAVLRQRQPLSDQQLSILDSLCDAADEAASATFRRLWRR